MVLRLKNGQILTKHLGISICYDEKTKGYFIIDVFGHEKFYSQYPTEIEIENFRNEVFHYEYY